MCEHLFVNICQSTSAYQHLCDFKCQNLSACEYLSMQIWIWICTCKNMSVRKSFCEHLCVNMCFWPSMQFDVSKPVCMWAPTYQHLYMCEHLCLLSIGTIYLSMTCDVMVHWHATGVTNVYCLGPLFCNILVFIMTMRYVSFLNFCY